MLELEKKIQEETFDVEVQYCDPTLCKYDCLTSVNHCNTHWTSLTQKKQFYECSKKEICKTVFKYVGIVKWRNVIWKKWRKEFRKLHLMSKFSIAIQMIVYMIACNLTMPVVQ